MNIIKPYLEARRVCKEINESGKDGVRSSKRTDVLNEEVVTLLKAHFKQSDGYKIDTEEPVACVFGNTFKIDVVVKKNGKNYIFLNLKAIQSSYNKNRMNYANTVIGETSRIFDHKSSPRELHSIWLDWIPNEIPIYNKNRELKDHEKPNPAPLGNIESRWNKSLKEADSSVCYAKIRFDYDEKKNTASNITGFAKLKDYLENLV